jgi:predicted enzyme related to lactoylglutathione lyase
MRRRLNEVALFTPQPKPLAEFYALVLDCSVPAGGHGEDAFNFDVEGVNLFIHHTDGSPPAPGWPEDVDHIAFEVEDLDAECERLRAAGLVVNGPSDFPWGRIAWLLDPDGRQVEIHGPDISYD